ncbi:MAG: hypothetical protein AB7Q23_00095 [Hyphomonadaceae bacterium]
MSVWAGVPERVWELAMADRGNDYNREVRDTVVKSGMTGVAATVLAVTIFSPAGFGGMIGASLASGFGFDPSQSAADNPYANLPAYPSPLTQQELSDINGELASTTASLEITRAATEAKIEQLRSLALSEGMVTFTQAAQPAAISGGLRLTTTEPAAIATPAPADAVVASATGGGAADPSAYVDPHLELAELFFAHEQF